MNEEFEMTCFQIITYVGTARTCFINAIQSAKEGNFEEAEDQLMSAEGFRIIAEEFIDLYKKIS